MCIRDSLWLDNTAKAGGKPWLNPNAQSAQTYLKALCAELGQKGVKEIILADATYPVATFLKDAGYGLSGGTTAQQALQASLDGIAQSAKESGAELSLYYPASPWMLAEQVNGVDYRALKADRLYVDVDVYKRQPLHVSFLPNGVGNPHRFALIIHHRPDHCKGKRRGAGKIDGRAVLLYNISV